VPVGLCECERVCIGLSLPLYAMCQCVAHVSSSACDIDSCTGAFEPLWRTEGRIRTSLDPKCPVRTLGEIGAPLTELTEEKRSLVWHRGSATVIGQRDFSK